MNIVIPMAGRGSRLDSFQCPKPLIKLGDKTLIEWALETLNLDGNYTFVIRDYENKKHNIELRSILDKFNNKANIISINYTTRGAACTSLLVHDIIDNDEELVIANCDQIMLWDSSKFIEFKNKNKYDGILVTYNCNKDNKSYVKLNEHGYAIALAEKKVISNHATNGIHWWKQGKNFVSSAMDDIIERNTERDEYYVAPTYNRLIEYGMPIGIYEIPAHEHIAVGDMDELKEAKQILGIE